MQKKYPQFSDESEMEEPIINLTPLIDVVFVVLITFMLIAPILNIDTVDLASGLSLHRKENDSAPISILVHQDNTIWFRGKKVTLKELEKELIAAKKSYPNAAPELIHDKKAEFGTYQSIKNLLEATGFEQMDVLLKPG